MTKLIPFHCYSVRELSLLILGGVCLLLFSKQLYADERCAVHFSAAGMGTAAGINTNTRELMAKKNSRRAAYRALAKAVYSFPLNREATVSSIASRNYNFRRQIQRQLRTATVVAAGYEASQQYKTVLEVTITMPSSVDRSRCQQGEFYVEEEEIQESLPDTARDDKENFLTRIAHELTDPVLDSEKNPDANFDQYTVVPPEQRLLPELNFKTAVQGKERIRDGVNMVLFEAVKRNQKSAPVLFRQAMLDGMDREVAFSSVLMGMINPTPDELTNLINQAVALGITRSEVDRSVNRVKQACSVCNEIENPASAPIREIESGPLQQ